MRTPARIILVTLLAALAISAFAESAKSLYNKGRKAEDVQDYAAAYEFYVEAYHQKPTELKYRIAYERTRFLAGAAHVKKGQGLREEGKLDEAVAEFEKAANIDPSSFIAVQEAARTRKMKEAAKAPAGGPAPPSTPPPAAQDSSITKRLEEASGPVDLAPVSQQPITLEISNDSKMVYETIGKLAGVNVLFDPDYTPRRIVLKLNGVSLQEALDIIAFNSNTFWRPVTANTIYVAANNQTKRKELEQNVLKTFYMSNLSQASELQDVVNVIRQMMDLQKVVQINSQNAIMVRGTPDQVAVAEKIVNDIDKAKPEVIVEVAVLQLRRDKMRQLGIAPPTSASIGLAPPTTSTTTTATGSTGNTATVANTSPNTINLNNLADLHATDFQVTIPSATANFLMSDDSGKLITNPQIRAADGQKASIKIGDRVPIATGSFGSGFSGAGALGVNGLVNTQFQYIDVGVNVDITPHVYPGREVGLKLVLEISQVTGTSTIGGIAQPIISQRKSEQEVRLKEGEVNLIGGMFDQTDSRSVSGIPGLGQLPFLKYFFSSEKKQKIDTEIVFVLIPRVVRGQEITEMNQKVLDIGTGTNIDLRRVSRPVAPATPATQQSLPPSTTPSTAPATAPATAPTQPENSAPKTTTTDQPPKPETPPQPQPAGPAAIYFDPPSFTPTVGSTFTVNVSLRNMADLFSAPLQISYDTKTLQLLNVTNGDMLSRDGQAVALVHREDLQKGTIQVNAERPPNSGGINGDGVLYTLTFQAKLKGESNLVLERPVLRNSQRQSVPLPPAAAQVSVK